MLRRIAGPRIVAGGRSVRSDPHTVTCDALGQAQKAGGQPAWTRFRCVQPTFPAGSVAGPDAIFDVQPTGPKTFTVLRAQLTHY